MLLVSGCENLFLITFQAFAMNGSEGACNGVGFSFSVWRSLFLITLHAFAVTGSEGVSDGVVFLASRFDKV